MIDNKVGAVHQEKIALDSSSDIKVSIIIPVYNGKHLRQCLDSIVNQTLKEIEVICINDYGSIDNSPIISGRIRKKTPRIRVITREYGKRSVFRNRAIQQAKGKYIGFMDSDDWADPTMFEKLYEKMLNLTTAIINVPYAYYK